MKFWCGSASGSADPDPSIFIIELQDENKKYLFSNLSCILLFEDTL
jgi:hypothetical protein